MTRRIARFCTTTSRTIHLALYALYARSAFHNLSNLLPRFDKNFPSM